MGAILVLTVTRTCKRKVPLWGDILLFCTTPMRREHDTRVARKVCSYKFLKM